MPPSTTHVLTLYDYTCFPSKKRRRRLALIKNTDKGLFLSNPRLLKSGGNSGFPVIGGGKMNSFCLFLSPRGCEEKEKEEEGGMGFPVCRRLIRRRGGGTFNNARMFLSKQQNISQVNHSVTKCTIQKPATKFTNMSSNALSTRGSKQDVSAV